jgi:beta-glucosidase
MNEVSFAIALECKARGLRMILSPVINLATDVRWGRVEETYGEDPYLSSLFGVSYVRAMESNGIITTPKHFVVNHGEGGRDSYPIYWNERWMRETYFKPFKAVVQKAGARSIMTAYNSYDGKPCTANNYLLNEVLRKQWGFSGFVISDAAATGGANVLHFTATDYEDAGKQSIENGLDVIFQTDFSSYPLFKVPFLNGSVNQQAIDSAVAHVLKIKFELGLFENPYVSENLLQSIDVKKHR